MHEIRYPFPNKNEAIKTLKRDYCFKKIHSNDIPHIIDKAWRIGVDAANDFLLKHQHGQQIDFLSIMLENGLKVIYEDRDYVSGNIRYFADYQTKRRTITIYRKSVELWAKHNGYNYHQALNIILMHEFFHYLEYTSLGYVSKIHSVYMMKMFGFKFGTTGISSLSEIAADAFAETVFKYSFANSNFSVETNYILPTEKVENKNNKKRFNASKNLDIYKTFSIVLTVLMISFNIIMFFRLPLSISLYTEDISFHLSRWKYFTLSVIMFCLFLYGCIKSEVARVQLAMTETIFAIANIFLTFINITCI